MSHRSMRYMAMPYRSICQGKIIHYATGGASCNRTAFPIPIPISFPCSIMSGYVVSWHLFSVVACLCYVWATTLCIVPSNMSKRFANGASVSHFCYPMASRFPRFRYWHCSCNPQAYSGGVSDCTLCYLESMGKDFSVSLLEGLVCLGTAIHWLCYMGADGISLATPHILADMLLCLPSILHSPYGVNYSSKALSIFPQLAYRKGLGASRQLYVWDVSHIPICCYVCWISQRDKHKGSSS